MIGSIQARKASMAYTDLLKRYKELGDVYRSLIQKEIEAKSIEDQFRRDIKEALSHGAVIAPEMLELYERGN